MTTNVMLIWFETNTNQSQMKSSCYNNLDPCKSYKNQAQPFYLARPIFLLLYCRFNVKRNSYRKAMLQQMLKKQMPINISSCCQFQIFLSWYFLTVTKSENSLPFYYNTFVDNVPSLFCDISNNHLAGYALQR